MPGQSAIAGRYACRCREGAGCDLAQEDLRRHCGTGHSRKRRVGYTRWLEIEQFGMALTRDPQAIDRKTTERIHQLARHQSLARDRQATVAPHATVEGAY